jgi:membrane-associated phospholipid phosphatase
VVDPLAAAVGISLLGPVVAGPVLSRVLARLPDRRRRSVEWMIILGAAGFAILADLAGEGPVSGASAWLLPALPGLLVFLVWRSLLATALVSLMPMYFVIALIVRQAPVLHSPELAVDRMMGVQPAWAVVYLSLYVFVVILPMFVLRDRELLRRAMLGYLAVMLTAYAGFLLYPTIAPRTDAVDGSGFAAWMLGLIYSLDAPYNCFPSLHVAYAFVAALACYRVHRQVGIAAIAWAALIGVSTVYTKQHYVADVLAGAAMGVIAYLLFLRGYPRTRLAPEAIAAAPRRAAIVAVAYALLVTGLWGWTLVARVLR